MVIANLLADYLDYARYLPSVIPEAPMARKVAKAAPKHVEPEEISQEVPEDEADGGFETHGRTSPASKSEAIRQAIAAGFDGPQEGTAYIRKEFGIEIAPSHFSSVKANEKKKGGAPKGKPGRKPKVASQSVEGYLAPPPKLHPVGAQPDLLAAMEAMKPLVDSLGKEQVKRIVELLG
jgi:hypothetical protein